MGRDSTTPTTVPAQNPMYAPPFLALAMRVMVSPEQKKRYWSACWKGECVRARAYVCAYGWTVTEGGIRDLSACRTGQRVCGAHTCARMDGSPGGSQRTHSYVAAPQRHAWSLQYMRQSCLLCAQVACGEYECPSGHTFAPHVQLCHSPSLLSKHVHVDK